MSLGFESCRKQKSRPVSISFYEEEDKDESLTTDEDETPGYWSEIEEEVEVLRRMTDPRQWQVLWELYGNEMTQRDLAEVMGLSKNRPHQIAQEALRRLRSLRPHLTGCG